jgi:hypothetical protein
MCVGEAASDGAGRVLVRPVSPLYLPYVSPISPAARLLVCGDQEAPEHTTDPSAHRGVIRSHELRA